MDKETNGGCFKMRIIEYHDFKTLMGPCFISFSIPLLIPGVVLTVVGSYGNEHTFSRFGAWHIAGIVILSFAVIMLIIGVILKCFYRPTMSADIEQHLSPNSSVITGSKNIGYNKDIDDDKMLNSKASGNKISPQNNPGKHNVVSTHEKRHRTHSENKALSNGVLGVKGQAFSKDEAAVGQSVRSKHNRTNHDIDNDSLEETELAKTIHVKQGVSHRNVTDSESEHTDRGGRHSDRDTYTEREPPPSYDEIQHTHSNKKRSRSKHSTSDNQAVLSGVEARAESENTIATATMTAEVTSHPNTGSSPRDRDSSDAKENTRFLPEKKRRKKKKRVKRRQSDMSETAESIDDGARTELPALRLRPVLIHEGEPHHNQHYHVHFQTEASAGSLQAVGGDDVVECHGEEKAEREHRKKHKRSKRRKDEATEDQTSSRQDRDTNREVRDEQNHHEMDNSEYEDNVTNGEFYV